MLAQGRNEPFKDKFLGIATKKANLRPPRALADVRAERVALSGVPRAPGSARQAGS